MIPIQFRDCSVLRCVAVGCVVEEPNERESANRPFFLRFPGTLSMRVCEYILL